MIVDPQPEDPLMAGVMPSGWGAICHVVLPSGAM
jgi:hypothetical protein